MEGESLFRKYSPYLRQYLIPLILGVLGLMFLGYGMIGYLGQKKDKPDILFEAASNSANPDISLSPVVQNKQQKLIVVDIEGAVEKPGVYKIASDSRMQDALIAAGGLGRGADREIVAKSLNLAAKLTDGMKVYVPFQGDKTVITDSSVLGGGQTAVNINSASSQELDGLPGIGKTTADKIISNRPYEKIEALVEKKVVGQKVFVQIKDKIVAQ
jgi:competence protein ComEA